VYDAGLRLRLVELAAERLADAGPEGLSLRRLADRAGTSTNAVYTIFGGKAGLVSAAVEAAFAGFNAAQRAVPKTDDPVADLLELGLAYRGWAVANPALYGVMFGRRVQPERSVEDDVVQAILPLLDAISRAVESGFLRPLDPLLIATSVWAGVHGLVSLELAGLVRTPLPPEELYAEHLSAVMAHWCA
jgi:AcrR family transcriptional regulator